MTNKKPFVIKNGSLKIGATQYADIATKSRLVPEQSIQTLRTLVPAGVVQDVDTPVWTYELTAGQDYTATTGLATIINTAALAGDTLDLVIAAKAGDRNATFTVQAVAVDFGGEQGAWNTFDATFPVVGQPVFGDDES